jgi:hypothetical protein
MPIRKKGGGLIRATFKGGQADWFENDPAVQRGGRRRKSRRKKTKKNKIESCQKCSTNAYEYISSDKPGCCELRIVKGKVPTAQNMGRWHWALRKGGKRSRKRKTRRRRKRYKRRRRKSRRK